MVIGPSTGGGAFDGLMITVAPWAAPASNTAITINLRALAGFVALFEADGSGKELGVPGRAFISLGVSVGFGPRKWVPCLLGNGRQFTMILPQLMTFVIAQSDYRQLSPPDRYSPLKASS